MIVYVVAEAKESRNALVVPLTGAGFKVRSFRSVRGFLKTALTLPDGCLVVDIDNLELDGLTLLEELKRTTADLPVILVADRAKAASVGAVKLLIADLLEKPFTDDFLVDSVRKAQQLLLAQSPTNLEPTSVDRLSLLSERERDILERIVSGMSNKSIASSLGMELRTVELCRISAMNKLGVMSLKELIRLALAAGIKLSAFTAAIGLAFR